MCGVTLSGFGARASKAGTKSGTKTKGSTKTTGHGRPSRSAKRSVAKGAKGALTTLRLKKDLRLVTFRKTGRGKARMACLINTRTGRPVGRCRDVPKGRRAADVMAR